MSKKPVSEAARQSGVTVRLLCIYSGVDGDPGPGQIIELPADEAARLIELGVAKAVVSK